MKYLSLLLLAGCSGSSHAPAMSTVHVSWQLPTAYTDGSALALSDIKSAVIHWGQAKGGPYPTAYEVAMPATDTLMPFTGSRGTYFLTVTSKLVTGAESAPSGELSWQVL